MQQMEAYACNNGFKAQWSRPNLKQERPMHRHPVAPMRHANKTGSSAASTQKTPTLRSVVTMPTDETIQLELITRLRALEAMMRRSQKTLEEQQEGEGPAKREPGWVAQRGRWPPRDDKNVPTPFSAEVEAEGKKSRIDTLPDDESPAGVDIVMS